MANQGNISPAMATVLKVASRSRLNILISGGTGSGKTTLLNALSQLIDHGERIVTIEDAAELQLQQPHVVRLETRTANLEGDLVKNSLRMRPDRIILGEVRGHEAVDMLQAMNTGHEGSMCTVHANRPREALTRLENMIGMAGINLPSKAVRTQITAAIDLIVQISRMRDGMRRVTSVTEVTGMEDDVIVTQELFNYEFEGEDSAGKLQGSFKSLSVLFLGLALTGSSGGRDAKLYGRRLERVRGESRQAVRKPGDAPNLRRNGSDSGIRLLDTVIKRYLPRPAVLRARLERTGLKVSPGEYLLFSVVIALLFGAIAVMLFGRSPLIALLSGLTSGLAVPHTLVKFLIARRLKAFTGQFPEAIDLIVRGLKSGLPVPASMQTVAAEIRDPVGRGFARQSCRNAGKPLQRAAAAASDEAQDQGDVVGGQGQRHHSRLSALSDVRHHDADKRRLRDGAVQRSPRAADGRVRVCQPVYRHFRDGEDGEV